MGALRITDGLRRDVQRFYGLREPVCNADVRAEYKNLAWRGLAGICGDFRREALRAIFARHGADPVHGRTA
jgi:hypothetical protein